MIIITGISGSIGRGIFNYYNNLNDSTIGTYNKNRPILDSSDKIFQVDISQFSNVLEFTKKVEPDLQKIILINCAAIVYDSFAHKSDPSMWKEVIDTNLTGTFNMIRCLLPYMREQEYGRIINISSVVAQIGAIGTTAYSASKAGLWGLTKSLSIENANKNILVNTINLGYMETGMTNKIPADLQSDILNSIPLKKFGPISEVLLAIDYLISSNYISGTSIDVNGGLY